jgi:hypothetical protein
MLGEDEMPELQGVKEGLYGWAKDVIIDVATDNDSITFVNEHLQCSTEVFQEGSTRLSIIVSIQEAAPLAA